MHDVYKFLEDLGIAYEKYEHPPVYTVEEAAEHSGDVPGAAIKNLFLRDDKGKKHFLVVARADAQIDLKKLAGQLGGKKLGFASSERLMRYLGVEPGSVSPLALINDEENAVQVYIDTSLESAEQITVHPNRNDATLVISMDDFTRFLDATGNPVEYILLSG